MITRRGLFAWMTGLIAVPAMRRSERLAVSTLDLDTRITADAGALVAEVRESVDALGRLG